MFMQLLEYVPLEDESAKQGNYLKEVIYAKKWIISILAVYYFIPA